MSGKKRDPKEYYNEELGDMPMTEREMDLVDEMNDYYEKLKQEHNNDRSTETA